jgi:isopenicillin-N epimerase
VASRTFDRSPWLLEPGISFLNHGSFGACPAPVLEAQRAWRERMEAEPVRFLDRELEGHLDEVRRELATFLNADPDGIAFVPNATTAVSTVLSSLRFQPGDELIAGSHEYNATLNALRAAAARDGARVVIARIPFPIHDPAEVIDAYVDAVTPRTRLALVSHVTSTTALVLPVESLVRELDRRGVETLVDGAHAPGMIAVDLGRLGAAYWTGNGYKWLCGPKGAAILHVRADVRSRIHPLVISHAANTTRRDRSSYRLEFDWTGTYDPSAVLALPAAIRYVGGLDQDGWSGFMAANASLARGARDTLCDALDIPPPAPDALLGSMVSIPLPRLAPTQAAAERLQTALFAEDRIEVPILPFPVAAALEGGAAPESVVVRVSAQRYNQPAEYARLADALVSRIGSRSSPRTLLGRLRRG